MTYIELDASWGNNLYFCEQNVKIDDLKISHLHIGKLNVIRSEKRQADMIIECEIISNEMPYIVSNNRVFPSKAALKTAIIELLNNEKTSIDALITQINAM